MSNGDTDFEDLKSSVFGIDLENAILSSSSSSSSLNNSSSSILTLSALEPPNKETTSTNTLTLTVPSNRPPSPLLNTSNGSSPSTPSPSSSITKSLPENRKLKKNVSFKLPTNITVSDIIAASSTTTTTTTTTQSSSPSPTTLDPSVDLDSLSLNKVVRTHSPSLTTLTLTNSEQQQQQQQTERLPSSETDTTNTNPTNVEKENNNKVSIDKEKPIINASTITNTATVTTIPNNITKLPPEIESPTPSPSALHISREGPNSKLKEQIKPKEILKHQDSLSPLINTPNPLTRINSSPRPIIHHTPTVTTTSLSLSPSPLSSSSSSPTLNSLNLHESSHNNVNMGDSTELVSMLLERLSSAHQERLSLIKKNMVDLKATFQTLQEEKEQDAREVTKIQQNAPPEPKKWDFGQYLGWILSSFLFVVLISVLIEEESDTPYFPGYT